MSRRYCEMCDEVVTPVTSGDCPKCGADTTAIPRGASTMPGLAPCLSCDGDGYGPNYTGNCAVCGGSGKIAVTRLA